MEAAQTYSKKKKKKALTNELEPPTYTMTFLNHRTTNQMCKIVHRAYLLRKCFLAFMMRSILFFFTHAHLYRRTQAEGIYASRVGDKFRVKMKKRSKKTRVSKLCYLFGIYIKFQAKRTWLRKDGTLSILHVCHGVALHKLRLWCRTATLQNGQNGKTE